MSRIKDFFTKGDARSLNARKNILALFFIKGINILTGFLIVPITINYVNATSYGVWLTLSSIIIWISYFDLGLCNGFRNKFAEAKAMGDTELARRYLSTTYALLTIVFSGILIVLLLFNQFANWSSILHLDPSFQAELHEVFIVLSIFFCFRVIVSVFTFMLLSDQKPALSAATLTIGQVFALSTIYILTKTTSGSLYYLALAIAGLPTIVIFIISAFSFKLKRYRVYSPSLKHIHFNLTRNILSIGIKFFVISIIILYIVQVINVILSRELGPIYVTQYNIALKYFSVVYMIMELIVSPFWSGFTEAYTKKDFSWMNNSLHQLEIIILTSIIGVLAMLFAADFVIKLWIGESVTIPYSLYIAMSIFVFFQSAYCIYSNLVNGIGKARLQLIVFLISSIFIIPFVTYGIRLFGLWGCMIMPTIIYIIQTILCRIQIKKLLSENAKGIWAK